MDREELLSLGVATDIGTACRALGISKSSGYSLARAGEFPTRVIRIGARYSVPTADLLDLLGITRDEEVPA